VLIFAEGGKTAENPQKNLKAREEKQRTTLLTYDPQFGDRTRDHRGERRGLPPLPHPCFPFVSLSSFIIIIFNIHLVKTKKIFSADKDIISRWCKYLASI
jgi:hypothetical protein